MSLLMTWFSSHEFQRQKSLTLLLCLRLALVVQSVLTKFWIKKLLPRARSKYSFKMGIWCEDQFLSLNDSQINACTAYIFGLWQFPSCWSKIRYTQIIRFWIIVQCILYVGSLPSYELLVHKYAFISLRSFDPFIWFLGYAKFTILHLFIILLHVTATQF